MDGMIPVLVTTNKDRRGVFFGYVAEFPGAIPAQLTLQDARNCIYWSIPMRGVFGLASIGPDSECKVGPKVPSLLIDGITSISRCTPDAAQRWDSGPWRS